MSEYRLGAIELKFADIIWSHEPLSSGELVKISENSLKWKKSTTYTILRRLCDRGIFKNDRGTVTSLISKEQFFALQSEEFVENTFDGSLPGFLTAFVKRRKLSEQEVEELKRIIDENRE